MLNSGHIISKTIQGTLIAAVLLILVATLFNSAFVAGGSGLVLLVGLIYAYVVSQREVERGEI